MTAYHLQRQTCKICKSEQKYIFSGKILNKYLIDYFYCQNCGFLQTEEPYWLNEAYSNAINMTDTGIMQRNLIMSRRSSAIILFLYNKDKSFLDYAGGYGIFVRLMRDIGFDFYWYDKYCENLVARGFEFNLKNSSKKIELITCFEAFEHFPDPVSELEQMIKISPNILFTTDLLPQNRIPRPNEWWYYGLEHGQHISFYSINTLKFLAKKYNLNLYTDYKSFHLLTEKKFTKASFQKVISLSEATLNHAFSQLKSKTFADNRLLIKKINKISSKSFNNHTILKNKLPKNILIIRTDAIGDNVIFTPALSYLKKLFPEANITLCIQDHIQELLSHSPYINNFITFNREKILSNHKYLQQIINIIKAEYYDLAIYAAYSREELGDILTLNSNARFKIAFHGNIERINPTIKKQYDHQYDFLITNVEEFLSEIEKNKILIHEIANFYNKNIIIDDFTPTLWLESKNNNAINTLKQQINTNEFILLAPTSLVPFKLWPAENWVKLIDSLKDYTLVITAAPDEKEIVKEILARTSHPHIINLAGQQTLVDCFHTISLAKLIISLDSAPAHLAVAAGTMSIIIMGGWHRNRFLPYSHLHNLLYKQTDCSGCRYQCKFNKPYCINLISVDDVLKKIDDLL